MQPFYLPPLPPYALYALYHQRTEEDQYQHDLTVRKINPQFAFHAWLEAWTSVFQQSFTQYTANTPENISLFDSWLNRVIHQLVKDG